MSDVPAATGVRRRGAVIVTRRLPAAVEARLVAEFDAHLASDDGAPSAAALAAAAADHDAILCAVCDRVPASVIEAGRGRLRAIVNFGVGVDHIDLGAARASGIVVTNTPDVLTDDTADLTMALILATARRTGEGERVLRAGRWTGWTPTDLLGRRVAGRTLGIVGWGRIGRAVARRASAGFGMRVLFFTPRAAPEAGLAERCDSLAELLARSDVVSLHCPSTPETRGLIDASALARMKPTAFLVNTARGDIVDEMALARALEGGVIAGAGLDVFVGEPTVRDELLAAPNAVLLPHLGSATRETREAMGMLAVENLHAVLDGREPPNRVA